MRRSDACAYNSPPPSLQSPTRTPPNSPPLWRFFVLAAVVVAALGSVLFAQRMRAPDLRVHAEATGTPSAARGGDEAQRPGATNFVGSGTWVMSSLPACFEERARVRGPLAKLRSELPQESERIRAASVLHVGACTVIVGEHDLWIARGNDRLHVPPEAALYRHSQRLVLVAVHGSVAEVRTY